MAVFLLLLLSNVGGGMLAAALQDGIAMNFFLTVLSAIVASPASPNVYMLRPTILRPIGEIYRDGFEREILTIRPCTTRTRIPT
jgi:hypothetical protein